MKEKEEFKQNILKVVTNETLLRMYLCYHDDLERYKTQKILAKAQRDLASEEYYQEKQDFALECFKQIEYEVLSRMMGMEID